jgi:hypothetical protein
MGACRRVGGFRSYSDIAGKRLELLRELIPSVSKVALLWNPANSAESVAIQVTRAAAQEFGISIAVERASAPRERARARTPADREHPPDECGRDLLAGLPNPLISQLANAGSKGPAPDEQGINFMPQNIPQAPRRCRQEAQGHHRRRHAQDDHHPQRHAPRRRSLAAPHEPTQLLIRSPRRRGRGGAAGS